METAGMKQEEEAGKRVSRNPEEINVGTKGKRPKQGLTIAEDLTIEHKEDAKLLTVDYTSQLT